MLATHLEHFSLLFTRYNSYFPRQNLYYLEGGQSTLLLVNEEDLLVSQNCRPMLLVYTQGPLIGLYVTTLNTYFSAN